MAEATTNRVQERFDHGEHALLPVVHVIDEEQARRNVEEAFAEDIDGVFLIDHNAYRGSESLLQLQAELKDTLPKQWIGVNLLSFLARRDIEKVGQGDYPVDGIWVDDAGIRLGQQSDEAAAVMRARRQYALDEVLYFGGVAMKGHYYIEDPEQAAAAAIEAQRYQVDVVTTSGSATGDAANPEKIKQMKQAIGRRPLAIASGISEGNVGRYLEDADAFLVASSIESDWGQIDPMALRGLVRAIRG